MNTRITEEMRAIAALPALNNPMPKRVRVSLALIQILTYYNKLTSVTSLIAVWWGLWTLVFPSFWQEWPVAMAMNSHLFGHAEWMSITLIVAGTLDLAAYRFGWRIVRYSTTIVELACWCLLAAAVIQLRPIFAPAAAVYTAFAMLKLMSWVSLYVGIDQGVRSKKVASDG